MISALPASARWQMPTDPVNDQPDRPVHNRNVLIIGCLLIEACCGFALE